MEKKGSALVPLERIERRILLIRGQKAMLDEHLAGRYEVEVRALVQAVKRNRDRFPSDFMFQLATSEWRALRSQTVTLKKGRGEHRKYLPYVFTEQGVAMLSSVLRSKRAIHVNIAIMRAFVRLRHLISSLAEVDRRLAEHDQKFGVVFQIIEQLVAPPTEEEKKHRIGFGPTDEDE